MDILILLLVSVNIQTTTMNIEDGLVGGGLLVNVMRRSIKRFIDLAQQIVLVTLMFIALQLKCLVDGAGILLLLHIEKTMHQMSATKTLHS